MRRQTNMLALTCATITSREYFLDAQGRMWYATPSNNKVGYFYLAGKANMASNGGR